MLFKEPINKVKSNSESLLIVNLDITEVWKNVKSSKLDCALLAFFKKKPFNPPGNFFINDLLLKAKKGVKVNRFLFTNNNCLNWGFSDKFL